MHGAGGGAPRGQAHGAWKHGGRSGDTVLMRRLTAELGRMTREAEALLGE